MNNKKTAAELIFQICSYEHLGSAANYEHDNPPFYSGFDANLYLNAREKNKNILLEMIKHSASYYSNKYN